MVKKLADSWEMDENLADSGDEDDSSIPTLTL